MVFEIKLPPSMAETRDENMDMFIFEDRNYRVWERLIELKKKSQRVYHRSIESSRKKREISSNRFSFSSEKDKLQ